MTSKTILIGTGLMALASFGFAEGLTNSNHRTKEVEVRVASTPILTAPGGHTMTLASKGTTGQVVEMDARYAKLRFITGATGWVKRADLRPASPAPVSVVNAATDVTDRTATLTLARELDAKNDKNGGGSVRGTNVPARSKLMSRAASFRGVRYVYGAASRSATDCSGFTTQVYRAVGIALPRVSTAQARVGKAVAKADLAPGDLVFFRTRGGSRISHVGIYVGPGGKFMHASSSSRRVTYNNLNEKYYASRYAGARRVLPAGAKPDSVTTVVYEAKKLENKVIPVEEDGGSGSLPE